ARGVRRLHRELPRDGRSCVNGVVMATTMPLFRARKPVEPRAMPTESQEQAAVVEWAQAMRGRFKPLVLLHASQAGARVGWKQAKKLKREGMREGVPDLFLPVPCGQYHGLWLEMKRLKGGRTSLAQLWWHTRLREQGYLVAVCKGADEAIATLFAYLSERERAA